MKGPVNKSLRKQSHISVSVILMQEVLNGEPKGTSQEG